MEDALANDWWEAIRAFVAVPVGARPASVHVRRIVGAARQRCGRGDVRREEHNERGGQRHWHLGRGTAVERRRAWTEPRIDAMHAMHARPR